jgi:hypothetical protein
VTPRVVAHASGVKGKGFKSSRVSPAEMDVMDGAQGCKGARKGEGSTPTSATVEDDGSS